MRSATFVLTAFVLLSSLARPAIAQKPELLEPRRTAVAIPLCSPLVPGGWRAIVWTPPDWTNADCQAFAGSVGATAYQVGCMFQAPSGPGGQKFSWATVNASAPASSNCGWPGPGPAAPPSTMKLCSAFVPNAWRNITPVFAGWTGDDCRAFARTMGATHVQLGCVYGGGAQKFAWARRIVGLNTPVTNALQVPATDCGWLSGTAASVPVMPVCSAYVPNAWRNAALVPYGWTKADCRAFARSQHATFYQLGCVYDAPPGGTDQRFAWGAPSAIGRTTATAPSALCSWRAS